MAVDLSRFPTSPEALDTAWLGGALGAELSGFRVVPLGEGAGLVGMACKLELSYADAAVNGPRSVIAKFPSPSPENRAVAELFDMYGREVRFYQRLADAIPVAKPHCYFAELDEQSNDFVLLLQDLSSRRIGDQTAGCGVETARLAIDAMARLHSLRFGSTEEPDLDWVPVHANPTQSSGMSEGFGNGWPLVLASFSDVVPAAIRAPAARVGGAIEGLLQQMCEPPLALVHGDFRLDNLFFGTTPSEPSLALIDWQSISKCCGEQDLAYFLTQSLRVEERRKHEHELVRSYAELLEGYGVSERPFERCWHAYRISALYLVSYAVVIAGTLDLTNERGVRLARALLDRSLSAVADLDAFELLPT